MAETAEKLKIVLKRKQKHQLKCSPLQKGDVVYLSPDIKNGFLEVTKVTKTTINKTVKDPADKKGKKTKVIKVPGWKDVKNVYISLYWKFNYLGLYKNNLILEYLEGSPNSRGRKIRVSKNYQKYFLKETPKKGCGKAPDRRPLHMIFTITKEIKEDKIVTEQHGQLQIGIKTGSTFTPFSAFNNIIIFTQGDLYPVRENIYIQIPTYQIDQQTYVDDTPYAATWFKVYEFPVTYSDPDIKEIDPYTRYMHIGNASDGCATIRATGQAELWNKLVKCISSARVKGPIAFKTRVKVKATEDSKTKTLQVFAIATMDIIKKTPKPKPKNK